MKKLYRMAMGVTYLGTNYHGWQQQPHDPVTIQQKLQHAIGAIANHPIKIICAGRTDAGVHAVAQVIHFETSAVRVARAWVYGTNSHLPKDIRIQWCREVAPDFHARFSAIARSYRYILYNKPISSPLLTSHVTWYREPLNENLMNQAANLFIGENDFSVLRASGCQAKNPIRTVYYCSCRRQGALVILDVKANAFLYHMVRNMVGVLLKVGVEQEQATWVNDLLQQKDRRLAGITAPASGLYFMKVEYANQYEIPEVEFDQVMFPI